MSGTGADDMAGEAAKHMASSAFLGPAGVASIFTLAAFPVFNKLATCTQYAGDYCIDKQMDVGPLIIDSYWTLGLYFAVVAFGGALAYGAYMKRRAAS
jgi:hypothetical protein